MRALPAAGPARDERPDAAPATLRGSRALERARRRHVLLNLLAAPTGAAIAVGLALHDGGVRPAALLACAVLYAVAAVGVTAGYHRGFTHRAFEAGPVVRFTLAAMGSTSGQGPLAYWVALHRMHHERSDRDGDPHSPHRAGGRARSPVRGFWHAHVGWMLTHAMPNTARYARDIVRDPVLRRAGTLYPLFFALGFLLPATVVGVAGGTWRAALDGLLWGGFVRLLLAQHVVWSINSVCHLTGSRPHPTGDGSTNVWWLALPSLGESWHNNHHQLPGSALHGFRWWQLDLAGLCIRLLEAAGLASNVRRPR